MLVLTRKTREQIQIGENVVITILKVKGQTVRVGIEAPRDVRVLRSELPKVETHDAATPAESVSETATATKSAGGENVRRRERNHRRSSSAGVSSPSCTQPLLVARRLALAAATAHCQAAAVRSAGPLSTLG